MLGGFVLYLAYMWLLALQRVFIDALLHVLLFPFWWVTGNIWRTFQFIADMIRTGNDELAPWLWLRNLFVPMFGQTDIQGRIVSIVMRFVNVIFRTLFLMLWAIVSVAIGLIWLALPVWLFFFLFWQFPIV